MFTSSVTLLMALSVALTIQSPTAQAEYRSAPCEFTFTTPGVPYPHAGAILVGGYVNCSPAPENFHVLLELMYKPSGGNWAHRAAETDSKTPNPNLNIATHAQCEPGAWQGIATMWVAVDGVTVHSPGATTLPAIIAC